MVRNLSNLWKVFAVSGFFLALIVAVQAKAQDTGAMLTAWSDTQNAYMPPNLDPAGVAKLFTEDGELHHVMDAPPGTANPLVGHEAIADFYSGFDKRWADWTHVEERRTVQDLHAVWEGKAQGTHAETGKFVSIPIAFSIDFDSDGKVKRMYVYVHGGKVAEQLQ